MKILIVDNDPVYLNLLAEVLMHNAYNVHRATDGEAALRMMHIERFDLVISDISMPGMNGISLHLAVRSDPTLMSTPFAWNSGYRELREVARVEDPSIDFVLDKALPVPNLLYFLNHLDIERKRRMRKAQMVMEDGPSMVGGRKIQGSGSRSSG
jgi:CheY-like chemotaxis protein